LQAVQDRVEVARDERTADLGGADRGLVGGPHRVQIVRDRTEVARDERATDLGGTDRGHRGGPGAVAPTLDSGAGPLQRDGSGSEPEHGLHGRELVLRREEQAEASEFGEPLAHISP
jgi:hypothetical protein